MLFFKRRKPGDQRSRKKPRENNRQEMKSLGKDKATNQKKIIENRRSINKRSGLYQKLPESKRNTLNRIIDILDEEDIREDKLKEEDKRRDDRYTCKVSEFVYVNLVIKDNSQKIRTYDLKVKDCTQNGLGILITPKDASLIENVNIGDQLKNVTFKSPWRVTSIDGIITHKTKLKGDYYKNRESYIIGLKSTEPIRKYRPSYQ